MQKKLSKQNNSGFTLSEVLIAVAILIVLMGLAFDAGGFSWPEIWADFFDSLTDNSMFF